MHPKHKNSRVIRQQRLDQGLGLISAIALITLTAVLSIAILRTVRTTSDSSTQSIISFRAFMAAESGAQLGANRVVAPAGSSSCLQRTFDFSALGLPSCTATVDCSAETVDGQSLYTLQSTSTCDTPGFKASHSILVRLKG